MSRPNRLDELRALLRQRSVAVRSSQATRDGCQLWPPGGLASGEVSEWIADQHGSGAAVLALATVRRQLADDSHCLVIDPWGEVSPVALEQMGWNLSRVVFARAQEPAEVLWTVEQGLGSRGVELVFCRLSKLPAVAFRRLKLAAETGGSRCVLIRQPEALRETSWADVRLLVSPLPSPCWRRRRLRVDVLKIRNGLPGGAVQLELNNETGHVRVVSELAHSADHRRAAGA